jgi:hypothetical protein
MDDYQPRIIARGEWEQDENGALLYIPRHLPPPMGDVRDEYGPQPGDNGGGAAPAQAGYRCASDDTWDRARRDYLAGETGEAVCERYDLRLGTLRHRAREEGWRRVDQPDPEPVDLEVEAEAGLPDYADMARHALVRLNRAILRGRSAEAAGWMRLHDRLQAMARATEPTPAAPASDPEPEPEPGSAPAPEPVSAPKSPSKRAAALDPQAAVLAKARAVQSLVRAVSGLDPRDETGRRLINKSMEVLDALQSAPDSDDSDHSDPVFSAPESETVAPAPGPS